MHLPAARFLERTLLFNFFIHALAMIAMALLLMSAIPGGPVADVSQRAAAVVLHPWRFRLGWFPWQLTALADLLLAVALVRTRWIPRLPAYFTLIVTLVAVVPDQTGQFLWITRGVELAREALRTGDASTYQIFETTTFKLIAGWGTVGYLAGAIGWTWCFAAAGTWSRLLTWLSIATWGIFALVTAIFFLPQRLQPDPLLIGAGNAIGFVLLEIWLIAVTERVLSRSRPPTMHGRGARWRYSKRGLVGGAIEWLANSAFVRAAAELVPAPSLVSDIRDVVYVNYLVEAERLVPFTPPGLELQRIGPDSGWTVFTFLIYRHGHFGPRALGPLRRLMPSPIQSNWRAYVIDPRTKHAGVYFVTTGISKMVHALAGRMLSEGVPMHVWQDASLEHRSDGSIQIALDPGDGSAPDARINVRPTDQRQLPAEWRECFADYVEMLKFIVPQDRALSSQTWYARICRQEINLRIPLQIIVPLVGEVKSTAATEMIGAAPQPLCFYVPHVAFRFDQETFDPIMSP